MHPPPHSPRPRHEREEEEERDKSGKPKMRGHSLLLLLALAAIPSSSGLCVPRSTAKLRGASRRPLVAARTAFARRQGAGTMDAGEDFDQLDGVSFERRRDWLSGNGLLVLFLERCWVETLRSWFEIRQVTGLTSHDCVQPVFPRRVRLSA